MKQGEVNPRLIALMAVMSAVIMALTLIRPIQTPLGGYVHLGDIAVNFAALAFGPVVGAVAGGVGTGLADLVGFPIFAIPSLIVHGVQGYLVGRIGQGKTHWAPLAMAVFIGGVAVILGYFIAEVLLFGVGQALTEVVPNIFQELVGAVGILVYLAVRRAYPPIVRYTK
ncbi:MAG: ECF transporter S component [Anaerolineae bacterium]